MVTLSIMVPMNPAPCFLALISQLILHSQSYQCKFDLHFSTDFHRIICLYFAWREKWVEATNVLIKILYPSFYCFSQYLLPLFYSQWITRTLFSLISYDCFNTTVGSVGFLGGAIIASAVYVVASNDDDNSGTIVESESS